MQQSQPKPSQSALPQYGQQEIQPQSLPQYGQAEPQNTSNSKKRSSKGLTILIIILVILFIAEGFIALFMYPGFANPRTYPDNKSTFSELLDEIPSEMLDEFASEFPWEQDDDFDDFDLGLSLND